MSALNYTIQDILSTTMAFCLFPLVIVFPGYVVGWIFDLFEFRARLLHTRFVISLLLSVAVSPVFYYFVTSWFTLNVAVTTALLIALAFFILLAYEKPALPQNWPWRTLFWVFLGWVILAIFLQVDLQWGTRELYYSVPSHDNTTRVSLIDAITRTGVPPINPSYYPGHPVKLTFLYFFWYILGSIIDKVGGELVDARTALFASIIWCGLALMAVIALYLRMRDGADLGRIWRRVFIGIASLSISGLDVIPAIALMYFGHGAVGDLEHWNEVITAWVGSLLWAPHHVVSLIAGFVGVMLLHSARGRTRAKRFIPLIFSGVAFASALGLSVWVTLVYALFWGTWMFFLYFQREQRTLLLPMLITGLVSLLLASPFLLGLLSGSVAGKSSVFPVALTVRAFLFIGPLLAGSSLLWRSLIRLLFLPLNYFLELGFFALAAFLWLKANKDALRKNPYYFAEVLLLGASFLFGTFTRSTVGEGNDLGWRAWMPGQFVLLIWGVDILENFIESPLPRFILSQRTKYNLILLLILGVSTSVLDMTLLRFAHYFVMGSEEGHRIYSARQAYSLIDQVIPMDAIVQYNPYSVLNRPSGLYGMRQSAISDRTTYGVPLDEYYSKVAEVGEIFKLENARDWGTLDTLCSKQFINVIVIVKTDPLWRSLDLLGRQRAALYADDYTSVYFCGNTKSPSP